MSLDLEHAFDTARKAATKGAEAAMRHWRQDLAIETKADESVVTIADREAEDAILSVLRAEFPEHALLGEETGEHGSATGYRWIVDPVDGTLGFSRGGVCWGPLVALEADGEIVAGALGLPALGELYVAGKGLGCWNGKRRVHVSDERDWKNSILSLGELNRLMKDDYAAPIRELSASAKSARCYGDCAAVTLVLEGRAEAWVEAGVKIWDVAPMSILLSEAGGTFTDMDGGHDLSKGTAVGTNGHVHELVLAKLQESRN